MNSRTFETYEEQLEKEIEVLKAKLARAESHRVAALEHGKADASKALRALAAAHYPTPEEGYGDNTSWAISDLCRCILEGRAWQPIETAPRGKIVLTWAIVDTETGNWNMRTSYVRFYKLDDEPDLWADWPAYCQPTHWAPLLAPPK